MQSISARLLISTALVLAIFVILTGLSVSYSVHKRAETALFDRLQGMVYGILGATEIENDQTLVVNNFALPESRLNLATSGIYAELVGNGGSQIWESMSTTNVVPKVAYSPIGEWIFERIDSDIEQDVHRLQMATVWELESGEELPFIVHVVADADIVTSQLRQFDRTLWISLLGSAILLLLLQLWVLNQSLKPLRHIGAELNEIEQGSRESLDENVPTELKPLAGSINQLLTSEKHRHEQYRHLLADLAHSLKTPLSVLKNIGSAKTGDTRVVVEQTDQMQNTVDRYLQRATMRTSQYLSKPVSPAPVLEKLVSSLGKIYHTPERDFELDMTTDFKVRVAEMDLYEVLGNVLDNACKYGATTIQVSTDANKKQLIVDDDGPGFPADSKATLIERGARADTAVEGQGLGLAASRSLMQSYGGDLSLDSSASGGARIILTFA